MVLVVDDYAEAIACYTQRPKFSLVKDILMVGRVRQRVSMATTDERKVLLLLAKASNERPIRCIGNRHVAVCL